MSDWVTIRNPAVQGTAEVTRAAAAAYAEKGWQIVEEQPPTPPAEADPPADPPAPRAKRSAHHTPEV